MVLYKILAFGFSNLARFKPSVELKCHDKEREESEPAKTTANDHTRII